MNYIEGMHAMPRGPRSSWLMRSRDQAILTLSIACIFLLMPFALIYNGCEFVNDKVTSLKMRGTFKEAM